MVKATLKVWASMLAGLISFKGVLSLPTPEKSCDIDLRGLLTDPVHQWASNTTISFPNTVAFENATERWSIFSPPTYSAAVSPGTEEDVKKVVNLARTYGFPFLTRGGGHGYAASLGAFKEGVSLDLSHWKSIQVNSSALTMTVGPGVIYNDIFDPLYDAGFLMQTGSCSCPSVIGVALGGGIGRMMGNLGLTADALQSVRLVGSDGIVKTVSETSYPDLFWAIRGAGANFGVITSATFNIQPLADFNDGNVFMLDFYLPAESSLEYFKVIETHYSPMPVNLAAVVVNNWNSTLNISQIASDWIFYGTEADARKVLAPIFALNASFVTATLPWNEIVSIAGGGYDKYNCEPNKPRSSFSLNQRDYNATGWQQGFEMITDFFEKNPGGRSSQLMFELFANEATAAVPENATCWPWTDVRGFIQAQFTWTTGDIATEESANTVGAQIRGELSKTTGYDSPTVFVNYARGDETIEDIYSATKLPRLAQLKRQYDPFNLFAYYHPLPLEYP
ncbi:conserved hypothetical protein [Talaromyces stipitatus ATCC 10500]|uniref:FAD-binding PCMH-type domain-containing protein n=1 Tax=Talaromyces stipitatus (strain ATCC 10500 / CBS 375.48 / QM 6759 / NRRL 1006) TaxID=441959 RepID=B8M0H3_TALSN|nr:uncharacterized protein TSTA_085010 [Talaromyces stipitatus ATCC 10500]EED21270.1 conserved hypothetical protein [Talaromyces stipitatus ATCC 10500]